MAILRVVQVGKGVVGCTVALLYGILPILELIYNAVNLLLYLPHGFLCVRTLFGEGPERLLQMLPEALKVVQLYLGLGVEEIEEV